MKIRKILIGLVLLGQFSCTSNDISINSFKDDPSITTLNGTWKVVSFDDLTANTTEFKTQENSWGKDIVVTFNDNINPKLFSGKVTTNSVQGEFEYINQRQFKLKGYGTTFVGQPVWADKFGKAVLDGNVTFRINSERLRIYYDSKTKSVTLTKE
ncbi:MAG: hypothetical protein IM631_21350 [Cytophagales bacterium]|nr:hypothetical protein [Cytophagales bacterium]MCA6373916.1 hypothetical protein [Cytophagales bacterium]MCA6376118.1 hypothetical protein [Cytophagales bacterium]MCA6386198.1 hypothetical protein [Cytophagales bacterium]